MKKQIEEREGAGRQAQRPPGRARRRHRHDAPAQRHQRRPHRRQEEDHPDDRTDQGRQGATYNDLVPQFGRPRRRAGPPRRPQEDAKRIELGERKALLADRIRSAYDTDRTSLLESFLSGGIVHRPPRRDELLHRRRRAGQGPGRADRRRTRRRSPRMHQTVRGHAGRTDDLRPGHGRAEGEARQEPEGPQGAKAELARLEQETQAHLAIQKARYAAGRARTRRTPPRRSAAGRRPTRRRSPGQIDGLVRRQSSRATSRRSTTARCAGRWRATSRSNFGCTGFSWEPPLRRLRPLPQRHRPRRAVRHAGQRVGRRRPSSTSAGTGPTAPTRPGSWSSPTSGRSRPGTPTCSRSSRAIRSGSTVKKGQVIGYEGNTGHSTGAAPPLGGRAQRRLREPAPVPVAVARSAGRRHRVHPRATRPFTFVRAARASIDRGPAHGPSTSWRLDGP